MTRADTSVVVEELRELGIAAAGTITLEEMDTEPSAVADRAAETSSHLPFGDDVIWEEVEENTSKETELSINYVEFFLIAGLIAAVGILSDSPILIVAAMVVSPEFGPIAAACVAAVQRRRDLARRSLLALAVGFLLAIAISVVATAIFRAVGLAPDRVDVGHPLTPAANIGVALAFVNWPDVRGATAQLVVNLIGIFLGGIARLYVQHRIFLVRRDRYERQQARRRVA